MVPTVTRIPRMHGLPPITWGSKVIRSSSAIFTAPREFESRPRRAPVSERGVNLEGVVHRRAREFWAVSSGARAETSRFRSDPARAVTKPRARLSAVVLPKLFAPLGINAERRALSRSAFRFTSGEREFAPE